MNLSHTLLEKIVSLCKRRGFIFQSAEIYGGLNGVYDMGPLGTLMKKRIRKEWIECLKKWSPHPIIEYEGSLLGPHAMWEASGHVNNFSDPLVDCTSCKHRFRADEIDLSNPCPHCGKKTWTDIRQFHLMFSTHLGAVREDSCMAYLRPETAQAIFVQFKNIMTSFRHGPPLGVAHIGKAFRNEITPKQFLFRMREFEQMELECFVHPSQSDHLFHEWKKLRMEFYYHLGVHAEKLRFHEHTKEELSHYARACYDIQYRFAFGWKELEGIAHRTDYDLRQHASHSGKELEVFDQKTNERYVPHVIECSVGVERLLLTLLCDSYYEDTVEGEERVVLRLSPRVAPVTAAILPLSKKQHDPAFALYKQLIAHGHEVEFDEGGSIGKRYRRYDEIGTPVCFTYDYDSDLDHRVTARNRDTLEQERISIEAVADYLTALCKK